MTKRECAIVTAYTGYCMLSGDDLEIFNKYAEEKMGRPLYTHEYYTLAKEIQKRAKEDFLELCQNARDEENKKEKILNVIDEEINKLQPPYKHIATRKVLQNIKEKIKTLQ